MFSIIVHILLFLQSVLLLSCSGTLSVSFVIRPCKDFNCWYMENGGTSSFMRTRRLESYFNASSGLSVKETVKSSVKEELELKPRTDLYADNDGWVSVLISWIKILICFVTMMFTTFVWALIMLVLLPWPYERIRQGNIWGHVTGRLMVRYLLILWIMLSLLVLKF